MVYLSSKPFHDKCLLTKEAHKKPVASFVDVQVLIDVIWQDQLGLWLAREWLQSVYSLQLLAYTLSRPVISVLALHSPGSYRVMITSSPGSRQPSGLI